MVSSNLRKLSIAGFIFESDKRTGGQVRSRAPSCVQLTLEQPGFELCGSIYMWSFFQ